MDLEKDFQKIYGTMVGVGNRNERVSWVESAWKEPSAYRQAYDDFWKARENLCKRFGMEWEDEDLERFMNGILELQEDLCRRMFYCGIHYAQNEMQG